MTAPMPHAEAMDEAERIAHLAAQITTSAQALSNTLSKGLQRGLEVPVSGEYRRLHLPGNPSKLTTDDELRTFVLDRIELMTFDQVVSAVAKVFPPARQISRSALHRWWHRTGKHAIRHRAQPDVPSRS